MAYTFFKSRGVPVGRSLVEDDKLDAARTIDPAAAGARRAARAAGRSRRHRPASRPDAASEVLAIGDPPSAIGWAWTSGPRPSSAYAGVDRGREDRRLERADGRLRDRRVRRPAPTPWRGRWRERQRHDDHRRRRFDCRRQEGGHRRSHHAHLDRRRRVARIPRRPHAARRRGARRTSRAPNAMQHPVHRRQLEDVQDGPRGRRLRQGAAAAS